LCTCCSNYVVSLVFQIINEFQEQGLNTELYYKNKDMGDTFSIVPTSAIRYESLFTVCNIQRNRQVIHPKRNWVTLVLDITVEKGSQISCCGWFNGLRKQWLRNLHMLTKCRSLSFLFR